LSALTAASNCSSFHSPWRSTKLCALRSCGDDTDFAPGRAHDNGATERAPGYRLRVRTASGFRCDDSISLMCSRCISDLDDTGRFSHSSLPVGSGYPRSPPVNSPTDHRGPSLCRDCAKPPQSEQCRQSQCQLNQPVSDPTPPVPRTRSSHTCAARAVAGFGFKKGHQNHRVASVTLIPKFASEGAAKVCELRNRDTSANHRTAERTP
jgi:hypothetical protein